MVRVGWLVSVSICSLLAAAGCADKERTADSGVADAGAGDSGGSDAPADLDGDGFTADADCDDGDATVSPGAVELCNGVDDNCDGQTDEDAAADAVAWFADQDADGFGDAELERRACAAPTGHVADATDCDDADSSVFPGAPEVCGDAVVNDCDGGVDAALAACPLTALDDLDDAPIHFEWADDGTALATALDMGGDVDGDGVADILVGHPGGAGSGSWEGRATLDRGGDTGDAAGGLAVFDGLAPGDQLGTSLGIVSDINGDGFDEVVLGAPEVGDAAGAVYLFLGPVDGTLSAADADVVVGGEAGMRVGTVLASVGDLNTDGLGDVAVGLPDEGDGAVHLWPGAREVVSAAVGVRDAPAVLWLANGVAPGAGERVPVRVAPSTARLGAALAGVGDVNGDGIEDLLVGAPGATVAEVGGETGWAFVVLGGESRLEQSGAIVDQAHATIAGAHARARLGAAVAAAGDVDGDGLADVLVGAPGLVVSETELGVVGLFTGAALATGGGFDLEDALLQVEAVGTAQVGAAMSGGGDIDGDGLAEVWVGGAVSAGPEDGAGAVYLYLGGASGVVTLDDANVSVHGQAGAPSFGTLLAGGRDVTGDAVPDLLVGSPYPLGTDSVQVHGVAGQRGW